LGRAGAAVALHYFRGEEQAAALLRELRSGGVRAMTVQADITSMEPVAAMRDAVAAELGTADVIVANAVIQYRWHPVLEQPVEDFASQFDSCVLHSVHLVKAFAPAMIALGRGRVIGINTECAMQCFETQAAYASAKRGMDGLYRVLARELGPHGITVNQVAPGWMVSDRHRSEGTEHQPEYEAAVPLRRRGTDEDVANTVAFLASDLAGFITGAFIPVCGGNVMPAI
jgi:3-oxoacyl-[acyl-carrier protein] reductase